MTEPDSPDVSLQQPTHGVSGRKLSEDIALLVEAFAERPVHVGDVIELMQHRAYSFLLILLCLPFCAPIVVPGLSTPFGTVVAVIGFRLAMGQTPWLPRRLLRVRLPAKLLPQIFRGVRKLISLLEYVLKPRLGLLFRMPLMANGIGLMIMISGLLLLLPLPIPFTNLMPAFAVILLAAGAIERDGYVVLVGMLVFCLTLIFFGALAIGGASAAAFIDHIFGGIFHMR